MNTATPFQNKPLRIIAKIFIVLVGTILASVFFGILLPFFSIAMEIVEDPGLAGLAFVYLGLFLGLLYGGIFFSVSEARSKKILSRYVAWNLIILTVLSLVVIICWITMPERFAHI